MVKIKVDVSNKLLNELPLDQEKLEEVLKLGLKQFNILHKRKIKSVVDETFGALPIKNHKLVERVCEQAKYGE
ncbi:MAG: hypothetical protein SCARUB_03925 [Candidatus Scalindua rubra]|uniref:Uncharacterized protein n=1 Tax=Candidatus Scalindua rubra TaxID=1872076 RepID=A0A1E3X5L2_9BACT|nr:MAG: hypothetical protein SCARUB_03925 [Candidatus Scalindua rubra]